MYQKRVVKLTFDPRLATDDALIQEIGSRVQRMRLDRDWTQQQLADEAGVSRPTLARLEGGASVQLTSLLRVLRVLDLLGNVDALVPEPGPSPMALLERQGKVRQRASGKTGQTSGEEPWTWGE